MFLLGCFLMAQLCRKTLLLYSIFDLLFLLLGHVEAIGKFTLKKFLLLVLFLDKAKLTRLIDHDPCLFNKEAEFKV